MADKSKQKEKPKGTSVRLPDDLREEILARTQTSRRNLTTETAFLVEEGLRSLKEKEARTIGVVAK